MTKTNVKSIRDADTTKAERARRSRSARGRLARRAGAAAGCAVAGLGLAYVTVGALGPDTRGSDLAEGSGDPAVQVLIDGWSLTTLGDREVSAQVDDRRPQKVRFEPVTSADINELMNTTPEVVEAALARLLEGDSSLACDTDGCGTDDGAVDPHALLLGGKSESVRVLQQNGVQSGLWKATVPVPADARQVALSASGYSTLPLPVGTFSEQEVDGGADAIPSLGNGFQRGRWLVAGGLGQLFTPDPGWVGSAEDRDAAFAERLGATPADAAALVAGQSHVLAATTGLEEPMAAAASWTSSQLTLATSPSKGCAAGILCFPGTLQADSEVRAPQFTVVASGEERAVVQLDDRIVTTTLPAPIRQVGIDSLLDGPVRLRLVTAALYAGETVSPVDWAGLVAVGDDTDYSVSDVLAAVRLAGVGWTPAS